MNPALIRQYQEMYNERHRIDQLLKDLIEMYGDDKSWNKIRFFAKRDELVDMSDLLKIERYHPEVSEYHHAISQVHIRYDS